MKNGLIAWAHYTYISVEVGARFEFVCAAHFQLQFELFEFFGRSLFFGALLIQKWNRPKPAEQDRRSHHGLKA